MAHTDINDDQADIKALADEIAAYLREREQVADTIEGIARWWIMRQRLQEGQRKVAQAMDYLCARGLVTTRKLPDGALLYTSNIQGAADDSASGDNELQDKRGN
jgi:hypothetical protein